MFSSRMAISFCFRSADSSRRLFQGFQVGLPLFFGVGLGRFQGGDFILSVLELGRQRQVAVQQVFGFVRAVEFHQGGQLVAVFLEGVFSFVTLASLSWCSLS